MGVVGNIRSSWQILVTLCLFSAVNMTLCSQDIIAMGGRHDSGLLYKDSTLSVNLGGTSIMPSLLQIEGGDDTAAAHEAFFRNHNRQNDDEHQTTTLNFEGSYTYKTNPFSLPASTPPEKLLSFFQNPKERDVLLKGGGNPVQKIPMTPELFEAWKRQSKIVHSAEPIADESTTDDPVILAITSTLSLVPGLSIRAISTMGCRFVTSSPGSSSSSLPTMSYELTLIKDNYVPFGAKPLVWVFNQITGINSNSHDGTDEGQGSSSDDGQRKAHALTRISLHHHCSSSATDDSRNKEEEEGLLLRYYGHVKVACRVPKGLMKIMPMSKARLEAKVSQSIARQIEREARMCLDPFRHALQQFLLQG